MSSSWKQTKTSLTQPKFEYNRYDAIRERYKGAQETIDIKDGQRQTTKVRQGERVGEKKEKKNMSWVR